MVANASATRTQDDDPAGSSPAPSSGIQILRECRDCGTYTKEFKCFLCGKFIKKASREHVPTKQAISSNELWRNTNNDIPG